MSKIAERLVKVFNGIFVIAPLGVAIILATAYFFGGKIFWFGNTADHFYLPEICNQLLGGVFILLFIALVYFIAKGISQLSNKSHKYGEMKLMLTLFALTLFVRIVPILLFSKQLGPFSDFEHAWNLALGETDKLAYYTVFYAYLNYSVLEKIIINIFGNAFSWVLVCNAVFSGVIEICIYYIAKKVCDNRIAPVFAAMLYCCFPAEILYSMIGTQEFITIAFNSVGMLLLLALFETTSLFKKGWLALGAGILFGVSSSYKQFSIIIIIAFAMAYGFKEFTTKNENVRARILCYIGAILIVLVGYRGTASVITHITETVYQVNIDTSASMAHFFTVGLNTEGEGQLQGELAYSFITAYEQNGGNATEAKEAAFNALRQDWAEHSADIIPLFGKKLVWAWQDDSIPLYYILAKVPDSIKQSTIYGILNATLSVSAQAYYLLALIGAMSAMFVYIRRRSIDYKFEFIILIQFGYFCLMLISECQSRYKCLIMPYIIILSAIGLEQGINSIKTAIDSKIT